MMNFIDCFQGLEEIAHMFNTHAQMENIHHWLPFHLLEKRELSDIYCLVTVKSFSYHR
jgi:hypothetical protein